MDFKSLKGFSSEFARFMLAPFLSVALFFVCLWGIGVVLQEKHASRLITDSGYRLQVLTQLEQTADAAVCQQMAGNARRYEVLWQSHSFLMKDYNAAARLINLPLVRELDPDPRVLIHGYMATVWRDQCLGQRLVYLGA